MNFKQNVAEQFLWESYNIDTRKYLITKMQESDESERKEIGKNVILQHPFQIRRAVDPGFRYHILSKIKKDGNALKMAKHYIEKLLLDGVYFDECRTFSPNPKNECNSKSIKKTVDSNLKHIPGIEIEYEDRRDGYVNFRPKISDKADENNILLSLKYFSQRYEMALEDGDELTATATLDAIIEYKTGMLSLFDLNKRPKFYWENVNKDVILYWQKYYSENLALSDIYQSINPSDFLYESNIMSLMVFLEFDDSLLDLLERFNITTRDDSEKIYNPKYVKFLNDAFSIASLIWFNSLDLNEKEKLLNRNYNLDLKIVKELIENNNYYDSDNFNPLKLLAMECFQNGFFDLSAVIFEYIFNHSDDQFRKIESLDKLGDIYREKMEYNVAFEFYKEAYENADKIRNRRSHNNEEAIEYRRTRKYFTITESLRMAEMEYMLGKIDVSNKRFLEVYELTNKAAIDEKISILWNLACTFKRTGQFEKEYRCLDKLAELGIDRRNDLVKKADERLLFLNNYDFNLDDETIKEFDLIEKKTKLLSVADVMWKSFQFEREIEYLEEIIKIDNDPNFRCKIALCYFNLKKMDFAEEEFKNIIEDTDKPEILAFCHLYLAFIHFKQKKNEDGLIEIEKSIKYGILCEEIDSIISTCIYRLSPVKKEYLLKQVLEKTLKIIELNYKDNRFILLHILTSMQLLNSGFVNNAVYFAENAHEKSSDYPEIKILSLINLAEIYSFTGEYEKTVKYLNDAKVIDPTFLVLWEKMAIAYANMLDFKHAEECMDNILAIEPENEKYKKFKYEYNELGKDNINFKKIESDEDVKNYFLSAERIVLDFANSFDEDEFDFSLSLVSYGKGLETMLHNMISKPLRLIIHKEYGTPIEKGIKIKDDLWDGDKNKKIKKLPKRTLKNIFGIEERSIQLGSWKYIFKDCKKNSNNEIIDKSRDYFSGKLNKNKELIFDACNVISEYRNGAAHYTSKSKNEIKSYRKEIVEKINNVISVLY